MQQVLSRTLFGTGTSGRFGMLLLPEKPDKVPVNDRAEGL